MVAVVREILSTPALLVGLVTLSGFLLQRKPVEQVVRGTSIAIVGFVLLSAGSAYLEQGVLRDFSILFNYDFHIQGVIPNMEAVAALGIARYAAEVSAVMLLGMAANLVMAKYGPFPYIFLTGHHTLYMACLLTVVLHQSSMKSWQIITGGALVLGLLMAWIPSLAEKSVKRITGGERIALGHFSTIGYLAAAWVASLTVKKGEERKKVEDIHFTKHLSFMRDSTVGIFLVTTVLFLLISGIAAMRTDLNTLDISYRSGGYGHWIIYALMQGAGFSVGIYIILAGVRLVVGEIVPAFKGIAKKAVPHAKPAVDCPILFTYAPNAVMLGFLVSFAGGIFTMLLLMAVNAWYGALVVPVIVPGVAAHFFCGGTAGVFANAEGGLKGCIAGSFVHGILISLLALFVMPVLGTLNLSGTTFSDTDFCVAGILFGELAQWIPENAVFAICVCCFALPIIWQKMKKRIES